MSDHRLVDRHRFAELARSGAVAGMALECVARAMPGEASAESRSIPFVLSDETVDRMGDVIKAPGWRLAEIRKNPVVLFSHQSDQPPIGRLEDVRVDRSRLLGTVAFAPPETSKFADQIFRLVKGGYLNAGSVGFRPIKYAFSTDPNRKQGIDFLEQELLEFSVTPIPANANALVQARAAGLETGPIEAAARVALRVEATRRFLAEQARLARVAEAARLIASVRR